jgi:hypothetical protein
MHTDKSNLTRRRRGAEGKVGGGLIEIHVNDFWLMMRFDAQ